MQSTAESIERKLGKMSYEEIEDEINSFLSIVPDLPRAFFLRYLNSMYAGDFDRAVDNLLRYFTYCIKPGGPNLTLSKTHYILLNLAGRVINLT